MIRALSKLPVLRAESNEMLHLDVLRFVSSVGIVVHHSFEFFIAAEVRAARPTGLALFVDLFFVISGFVIARIYQGRVGTLAGYGKFLQRRVGRLVPLHLLTLFASIAVWSLLVALGKAGNHEPSFEPRCIIETAFFLHAIVSCGNGISFTSVSWSIGAEMVMYLIFPIFAWLATGKRQPVFLFVTLFVLLVIAIVDAQQNVGLRGWVDLWPIVRALPSFMLGVSLFCLRDQIRKIPVPRYLLPIAVTLMVIAMLTNVPHLLVLLVVYAVVIIAIAADTHGRASPSVTRLAPLGQLTYSIYMWHSLVILIVMNGIGDKVLHASLPMMAVLCFISFVVIFALSYVSYFVFETPARRFIDSLGSGSARARAVPTTS